MIDFVFCIGGVPGALYVDITFLDVELQSISPQSNAPTPDVYHISSVMSLFLSFGHMTSNSITTSSQVQTGIVTLLHSSTPSTLVGVAGPGFDKGIIGTQLS